MNELRAQRLVVEAVRERGGAAHKLSSRFLIGVSDLLVKLPQRPAALVEVKLHKFKVSVTERAPFTLDLTHAQEKFLTDYASAGMVCGVMSFVELPLNRLFVRCLRLDDARAAGYRASIDSHAPAVGKYKHDAILVSLENLCGTR